MTTHARLRQVADKMLAAYSDLDFYRRVVPEVVDRHDEKLTQAHTDYEVAKGELLAVLE